MEMTIEVKRGVGDLVFGMPVEDVVARLGKPDSVEEIDNAADENTTVVRYDDEGLTLFFEGEEPLLSCIDVCNEESKLFGEEVFCLNERKIVELMVANHFYEQDIDQEEWGERRVSFPEANIDFFFDGGSLVSIVLGM